MNSPSYTKFQKGFLSNFQSNLLLDNRISWAVGPFGEERAPPQKGSAHRGWTFRDVPG